MDTCINAPFASSSCKGTRASAARAVFLALAAFILSAALLAVAPAPAQALEVESCTASPNEDGGNRILGATPTRVTWRAHAAEDESLSRITLAFADNVELNADKVKVTGLAGLDRVELNAQVSAPGDGTIVIDMPEASPAGVSFLVEVYNVVFPGEGGEFQVAATTQAADGTTAELGALGGTITVSSISMAEQIAAWLNNQGWVQAWNSNKFLHLFFDPAIIVTSIPSVFNGWLAALGIVVIAFPAAIPVGFLLALMRMARFRLLRAVAGTYVNVVRGTPMFLQIYIAFFGLPLLGLNINNFALGCCVMALNSSAYLCEIFRAGIQSISKGQFEAARSLGMNGVQTMIHVIAPQAFRRVIPTMTNELILLYKDTSLLAAVGIMETVMYAKTITAATGNITPYIVAAGFYLIVTLPMSRITRAMEDRTGGRKVALKKKPADKEPKSVQRQQSWEPDLNAAKDELAIKTADL
ncbi:MAG: amino acid ABC transporter permease [Slackia sp.]|nr:amino acid ABC transporter permease [Slackia sp.]